MPFLDTLRTNLLFRFYTFSVIDFIDIALVTISFYVLFLLIRRSQAALLLRGLLVLALLLLITTLILPLPTFDLLVWVGILAILIATPVTLQPELRRLLERIGRRVGWRLSGREDIAERVIPPLLRATENLSSTHTGALIVLEGSVSLQEVMRTGVAVDGRVTAELLQTIFFDKTPLHDGAAVVRGDKVLAAGCVLPLTERALATRRRLGTRHRAAVGMSENSDALIIVVSEETGTISVAQSGKLERPLDSSTLRQRLADFYARTDTSPSGGWLGGWRPHWHRPTLRQLLTNLAYLALSFLLALVAATVVRTQTDPIVQRQIEGVPLRITNLSPDTTLMEPPPPTVSINIQTTESVFPTLGSESFQASVEVDPAIEGLHSYPVNVSTSAERVYVVGPVPAEVAMEVAPVISRTLPIVVRLTNLEEMSQAYEVRGDPIVTPEEALISGPAPLVGQVQRVQATVSMANATTTVRDIRPLQALDVEGRVVDGVTVEPEQAQVQVLVRRRSDARDVGIRAVTTGAPPDGYWLSGLSVIPAGVTVRGDPDVIAAMDSYVDTLPVDLSDAVGELRVQVPLAIPADVQAVDSTGNAVNNVTVIAQIAARRGDLLLSRPVQIINVRGDLQFEVSPAEVELLLSGPLPTLNEIAATPELVSVTIDASTLLEDQQEVTPTITVPEGVVVQSIENTVVVTAVPPETPAAP